MLPPSGLGQATPFVPLFALHRHPPSLLALHPPVDHALGDHALKGEGGGNLSAAYDQLKQEVAKRRIAESLTSVVIASLSAISCMRVA